MGPVFLDISEVYLLNAIACGKKVEIVGIVFDEFVFNETWAGINMKKHDDKPRFSFIEAGFFILISKGN